MVYGLLQEASVFDLCPSS